MFPQAAYILRAILPSLTVRAATAGAGRVALFSVGLPGGMAILSLPITYPSITVGQYVREQFEDKEAIESQKKLDEIPLSDRKLEAELKEIRNLRSPF